MPFRLSLENYIEAATITVSSEQSAQGYGKENLKLMTELDQPHKTTTATGDQWVVFDFGSAKAMGRVAVMATNYATARIQMNSADSWGGVLPVNTLIELVADDLDTRRLRYNLLLEPEQTYRYLRLFIPSGTPTTDGASSYRTGVVTAGPVVTTPMDILLGLQTPQLEAVQDVTTLGGRVQRSRLAPPLSSWRGTMRMVGSTAYFLEEIKTTNAILRQWKDAGRAVVSGLDDETACVHVMALMNEIDFPHNIPSDVEFDMLELG